MKLGASTACFYPLETEKALLKVTELGYKYAEVFMNAPSELEEPFLKQLNTIAKDGGTDIVSVHPFSSFMESTCIFTDYQRRFDDFISIYDKTCHACACLGAKYVVIHGAVAHPKIPIPDERYFERFNMLIDIGKREGVTVCQENVNRFKSESIEF
jgi:sugar phosphate isomerase/epimerase